MFFDYKIKIEYAPKMIVVTESTKIPYSKNFISDFVISSLLKFINFSASRGGGKPLNSTRENTVQTEQNLGFTLEI